MSTRLKRIEVMIEQAIREALVFDVETPGLSGVDITAVSVTPDLRLARVNYVLSGGVRHPEREAEVAQAFKRVSGFLRKCVNEKVQLKYSPELAFYYDEGREQELKIERIFHELENEK